MRRGLSSNVVRPIIDRAEADNTRFGVGNYTDDAVSGAQLTVPISKSTSSNIHRHRLSPRCPETEVNAPVGQDQWRAQLVTKRARLDPSRVALRRR